MMSHISYAASQNDPNQITPNPCHMRHSQILDKIDSFLKPVLNIFILCNVIVEWGRGGESLVRRRLVFCMKSIGLGEMLIVAETRIHQEKVGIIQGPSKHLRFKLFVKIVFGCKLLTLFRKKLRLRYLIGFIGFQETFLRFFSEDFAF